MRKPYKKHNLGLKPLAHCPRESIANKVNPIPVQLQDEEGNLTWYNGTIGLPFEKENLQEIVVKEDNVLDTALLYVFMNNKKYTVVTSMIIRQS
jgi:hypothetical protein